MTPTQRLGRAVALVGAATFAVLTLYPIPGAAASAARTPLLCLVCGERGGVDVISNVLLTMPLGLGLQLATGSWRGAVAWTAAASLTVELLQLTVVVGRDASLSDLLSNTVGGMLGGLLGTHWRLVLRPGPDAAWRLLLAGMAAVLALLGAAAWLQTPDFGKRRLTSSWAFGRAHDAFLGRVFSVTTDGRPGTRDGVPPDSEQLRRALREGRIEIETRVETGPPSGDRRWIYVIGERGQPRLFLSRQGRTAVFGVPTRSVRYRLHQPTLLLRGAFPRDSGVRMTLRAGQANRRIWLASHREGDDRETSLALSPTHGWALIVPFGLGLGGEARALTAALIFGLALPLGYWAKASRKKVWAVVVLAAGVAAGLGVVPTLTGYPPVHWSEWLAAAAGAAAGWALARGAAYLEPRCASPSASVSSSS